jgi:hypothetical protein
MPLRPWEAITSVTFCFRRGTTASDTRSDFTVIANDNAFAFQVSSPRQRWFVIMALLFDRLISLTGNAKPPSK